MNKTVVRTFELMENARRPELSPSGSFVYLSRRGLYSTRMSHVVASLGFPRCRFDPKEEFLLLSDEYRRFECRHIQQPSEEPFFRSTFGPNQSLLGFTNDSELLFCETDEFASGETLFALDPKNGSRRDICRLDNESVAQFQDQQGIHTFDDRTSLADAPSRIRSFENGASLCECPFAIRILLKQELFLSRLTLSEGKQALGSRLSGARSLMPGVTQADTDHILILSRFDRTVLAAERLAFDAAVATDTSPDGTWMAISASSFGRSSATVVLDLSTGLRHYSDSVCSKTFFCQDRFFRVQMRPDVIKSVSIKSGLALCDIPLATTFLDGSQSVNGSTIMLFSAVRNQPICQIICIE